MAQERRDLHVWYANADGTYAGELDAYGTTETLEELILRCAERDVTVIDKTAAGAQRPPDPAPLEDPLKASYAAAGTTDAKIDVLAQRLGLM